MHKNGMQGKKQKVINKIIANRGITDSIRSAVMVGACDSDSDIISFCEICREKDNS